MSDPLTYALFPVNFLAEAEMVTLLDEYDELAQFFVMKIIMLLSKTEGATVNRMAARGLRGSISKEQADIILDSCISFGIFEAAGDCYITRSKVRDDQDKLSKTREEARLRKLKSREEHERSRDGRVTDVNGTRTPVPVPVPVPDPVTEDLTKEGGTNVGLVGQAFPEALDTPEIRKEVTSWVAYLRQKHRKNLTEFEIEPMLMRYSTRPGEFLRDLRGSRMNGWKTLQVCVSNGADPPGKRKQTLDEQIQAIADLK